MFNTRKYVLNICYVLDIVVGTRNIILCKIDTILIIQYNRLTEESYTKKRDTVKIGVAHANVEILRKSA